MKHYTSSCWRRRSPLRLRRAAARAWRAAATNSLPSRSAARGKRAILGTRRRRRAIDTGASPADTCGRVCGRLERVARHGCPRPAPEEPSVIVSHHSARAAQRPTSAADPVTRNAPRATFAIHTRSRCTCLATMLGAHTPSGAAPICIPPTLTVLPALSRRTTNRT